MIEVLLATGAGASAGYTLGDWVIQGAPVVISVLTAVTAIKNKSAVKSAQNDPIKLAMAKKLEGEGETVNSILERFDSLTELLRISMQQATQDRPEHPR